MWIQLQYGDWAVEIIKPSYSAGLNKAHHGMTDECVCFTLGRKGQTRHGEVQPP